MKRAKTSENGNCAAHSDHGADYHVITSSGGARGKLFFESLKAVSNGELWAARDILSYSNGLAYNAVVIELILRLARSAKGGKKKPPPEAGGIGTGGDN